MLAEQLKRQGVDATFAMPPDFDDRFQKGDYTGAIFGHGGSVSDPYYTLRLYQSATMAVPGGHLVNFAALEERRVRQDRRRDVYVTPPEDKAKLMELCQQAMEIWLPELPDIQLDECYHRIPMNTTYWTELADRGEPVRQRRLLAPDLPARAAIVAAGQ